MFRCPGKAEVAKLSAFAPAYLYQFEYPDGRSQLEIPILGLDPPSYDLAAFHSADISYVFGYNPVLTLDLESQSIVLEPWEPGSVDETLWREMLGYFSRFAATGDPSGEDAVDWPLYDATTDRHLVIDAAISVGANAAEKCEFWDGEDYLEAPLFTN